MDSISTRSKDRSHAHTPYEKSSFYLLTSPLDSSAKPIVMSVIEPISDSTPSKGQSDVHNPLKEGTVMESCAKSTVAMNGTQPNLHSTPSTGLAVDYTLPKKRIARKGIGKSKKTISKNQPNLNSTPSTDQSDVSTPKNEEKALKSSKKPKKKKGTLTQKKLKSKPSTGQSYVYTPHKQGSALDKAAKPIVMNVYQKLREWFQNDSMKVQVQKTSELTGVCERTIYRVKKEFETTGSFTTHGETRPLRKGKGTRLEKYDDFARTVVQEKVHSFYQRNETPTVAKVRNAINEDPRLPTLSICTTRRLLKDLGFVYEKTPDSQKPMLVKKEKKKAKPKKVSKKSPTSLPGTASLPVSAPASFPAAASFPVSAADVYPEMFSPF